MFVIFLVYNGSFLFFHQAPQVEVELKERKILKIVKKQFG